MVETRVRHSLIWSYRVAQKQQHKAIVRSQETMMRQDQKRHEYKKFSNLNYGSFFLQRSHNFKIIMEYTNAFYFMIQYMMFGTRPVMIKPPNAPGYVTARPMELLLAFTQLTICFAIFRQSWSHGRGCMNLGIYVAWAFRNLLVNARYRNL
jgi:hypothetical protein